MKDYPWQTIIGQVPAKANSYRIIRVGGHSELKKTDAVKSYENSFYMQVGQYRNLMIEGFYELHLRVYFKTLSNDLDNAIKTIGDCLQQTRTIKNDNRCVKIVAEKFIDKNNPRIEFSLVEV